MNQIKTNYGPRERLLLLGEARLSDAECLALILRTGTVGSSAQRCAQSLLDHFGGLAALVGAEIRELIEVEGIGRARACSLGAAFGIARRLSESRFRPGSSVRGAGDVARLVREATRGDRREHFFAALLDVRHRLLSFRQVSTGSLVSAPVHPREVFQAALRAGAAAVVLAHNHPSGDASPSADDRQVTERMVDVGVLCGIEVLDHVVVGHQRYFSFADEAERDMPGAAFVGPALGPETVRRGSQES